MPLVLLLMLLILPAAAPWPAWADESPGTRIAQGPPRREADQLHPRSPPPRRVNTSPRRGDLPGRAPKAMWTRVRVDSVKAGVALAGASLLAWGAWLGRRGRTRTLARTRDTLLASLGLLALLCWWNLLQFHYPGYGNPGDNFHYYLGAKYFRELGYTRLYACAALADHEAGFVPPLARRTLRNLETNRMESGATLLEAPERCKEGFSAARWEAFGRDVAWLRDRLPPRRWQQLFSDHGYNATPAWGVLGSSLVNTGPLSAAQLRWLTLLDPVLLLAMWASCWWAFGWRAMCVGLLFWGTNYAAGFAWTGGGILRQDWLFASVMGLCLLRRGWPFAGGFALALAALLRVFPLLLLAAVAAKALVVMFQRRALWLAPEHRRIALGALAAVAIALPLSAVVGGGFDAWSAFARNSRLHLDTPLRNHMGLSTALAHATAPGEAMAFQRPQRDRYAQWKAARRGRSAERRPLFLGLALAFAGLVAIAVARQETWVAAALGVGLIPVLTELTSYYYAFLLAFAFLWTRRESIGVALAGLSALSWGMVEVWHFYDDVFARLSIAVVLFVTFATALMARTRTGPSDGGDAAALPGRGVAPSLGSAQAGGDLVA